MGFTYRDNYVYVGSALNDPNGNFSGYGPDIPFTWKIVGGSFTVTDFRVTEGQDPNHELKKGKVHEMKDNQFLFKFGRHGDKDVANSFNDACPPKHNTFNHKAGNLNFWVKGTLVLTFDNGKKYTFPNTFLAQGHSGASNNWWFGNDTMENEIFPIHVHDPNSATSASLYLGNECYGAIAPAEDPNMIFKFKRGTGGKFANPVNYVELVGIYYC